MSRVGDTIGGKFELTEQVGRSEFGATYRAATSGGRIVAVKLFHSDLEQSLTRTLFSNAKIVSGIKHSRIARVLGAKYSQGNDTYLVTEWMTGKSLTELLKNQNHCSPSQTADILFQLCSALAPLHKANLCHGNLKPSNVFINHNDSGKEQVCITDIVGSGVIGRRRENEFVGSVKNMSPEQVVGTTITPQSDFFALGVLGYRLLSGQYPFAGPTPAQTADRIQQRSYKRLSEITSVHESSLTTLIEQCIQQESNSLDSLRDIAQTLANFLKGSESSTSPEQVTKPSETTDDPDATMAFQVPDELQAFLDQHDGVFNDESVDGSMSSQKSEREETLDQPLGEVVNSDDLQQPFFTESRDELTSAVDNSVDLTLMGGESLVQPGQEIDDDLPFNSISVSQSILEEEASNLESVDELDDNTLFDNTASEPVLDGDDILESNDSLEAEDIMSALSSTIEAVGPADKIATATVDAPLLDLSDFKDLATGELERRAKDSNRFLSTTAQTGLKRPIFTLFLLGVLASCALLYQFMLDEDSDRFKAEQAAHRQARLKQLAEMKTGSATAPEKPSETAKPKSKPKTSPPSAAPKEPVKANVSPAREATPAPPQRRQVRPIEPKPAKRAERKRTATPKAVEKKVKPKPKRKPRKEKKIKLEKIEF